MRKNRIRILHVAQAAGGVERYIRMLLKYLDKEKFENILVCSQDFREEDYDGLVDSFEQIELNRAIGANDLRSIVEIRKLVKKYNPDIVYAHSSKAGAITRVADIGLKNHCVYNPHGWAFNMRCSDKKRMMYTAIEKIAALFCDKIICISDAEKQSALDKKICREDKLQVIFNGVDIESYESGARGAIKRRDLNIPKDAFVVVNDKFFYSILSYNTKPANECKLESHRKYIDIQIIVDGEESIEVVDISKLKVKECYDEEKDVIFWRNPNRMAKCTLRAGDYIVLYPENAHRGAVTIKQTNRVLKIVGKVALL